MNSFVNAILLALAFPLMALAIVVGFDLPVEFLKSSGKQLSFAEEIFWALALLMGILSLRRSTKRWMGMKIVTNTKRFLYNHAISQSRKKRVIVYNCLESAVLIFLALGIYVLTDKAIVPAIVLGLFALDSLVFLVLGNNNRFRVGISSKAIIVADREVIVIYFEGLRKVSVDQQTIYFDYIKDLQLSFPTNCILDENKSEALEVLQNSLDKDKVMFYNINEWK